MELRDFTSKKAFQVLATQSRRSDLPALQLSNLHREMGKLLAYEMIEDLELEDIEIQHVQGKKHGVAIKDRNKVVIIAMMRAGLFAAEGIREVFSEANFFLMNDDKLDKLDLTNKTVIIVDSVINTGRTIQSVLAQLQTQTVGKTFVATLVMQQGAIKLTESFSDANFYAFRVSENKYTGKGGTDTGNRLFNTIS